MKGFFYVPDLRYLQLYAFTRKLIANHKFYPNFVNQQRLETI